MAGIAGKNLGFFKRVLGF